MILTREQTKKWREEIPTTKAGAKSLVARERLENTDPRSIRALDTIDAMLPLVEELAKEPCHRPSDHFVPQGMGRKWETRRCGTCPPCRARTFLEEFER